MYLVTTNRDTDKETSHRLLDQNEVLTVLRNSGQTGVPSWYDRVNRIYLRAGFEPSTATILLRNKDLKQVDTNDLNHIFRIAPRFLPKNLHFDLNGWVFQGSESLTPSFSFQRFQQAQPTSSQYPYSEVFPDDQVRLVEFKDVRCQFHRTSAAGLYYNVIESAEYTSGTDSESITYYTSTTNSGPAWTWVGVLQDLWSYFPTTLTLDTSGFSVPLAAGTSQTFTPYNIIGDGLNVWELFQSLVDSTGHALGFDGTKFYLTAHGATSTTESSLAQLLKTPYQDRIVYHTNNYREDAIVPYSVLTFFPTGDVSANAVARDDISTQYEVSTGSYRHYTTDLTSVTVDRPTTPGILSSGTDMVFVNFNLSTSVPDQLIQEIGPELARRHYEYLLAQIDSYGLTLTGNHNYPIKADHKHREIIISQESFGISINYTIAPPDRLPKMLPSSGGEGAAAVDTTEYNGVGILTSTGSAAAYTDSTNTLVCGQPELRKFRNQSGGTLDCFDKVTNAYWAGDEAISISSGKGRLCYWMLIGDEYFVEPSCNEVDFDISTPEITTTTSQSVDEGTTSVVTVSGTDIDTNVVWSVSGGADSAFFEIDESTGALSFKNAPDFDNPLDADTNNVYVVEVQALNCDGETDTETFNVTVNDVP